MISSTANDRIKSACKLREAKHRRASHRFLLEGILEINQALAAGYKIGEVYYCQSYLNEVSLGTLKTITECEKIEVSEKVFAKLAMRDHRDGLIVVAKQKQFTLNEITLRKPTLVFIIEGIEKPGNLGALLRVADGVGASAVVCVDAQVDVYNPNCIRASIGAVFSIPTILTSFNEIMDWMPSHMKIVSTWPDTETSVDLFEANLAGNCAMVLGAEDKGLTTRWREASSLLVSIPMRGQCDSLNISVAGAVVAYQWLKFNV